MDLSNSETRHIKKDGLEYLEFKAFDEYRDKVLAAFVIRGENEQNYFDIESSEFADKINKELGFGSYIQIAHQVHGDACAVINRPDDVPDEVDSMITKLHNVGLVERVADCVAVFIYDPVKNVIGNVHSGWRGTIKRITPKVVRRMEDEFGSRPEDLICVLCPSIGFDHFEVEKDVKDLFVAEFGEKYMYDVGEKTYIDAPRHIAESLMQVGVELLNIHDCGVCTVCNHEVLYSYRADKDKGPIKHNAAIIGLK